MEPKWGLGAIWGEDKSGKAKKGGRPRKSHPISEVIFVLLEHLLRGLFLMFFGKACFSVLGRLVGAQGAKKGAKMSETTPKREAKESSK